MFWTNSTRVRVVSGLRRGHIRCAALCAAGIMAILAPSARAVICYVDSTTAAGGVWPARGGAWGTALNDMQLALAAAAVPANGITEIRVAQGTYRPTPGAGRGVSFQMVDNVAVIGGFPIGGAVVPAPGLYVTILSGDIGVVGVASDNSYHVVQANGTGINGSLSGFKIVKGYANGAAPNDHGGGILIVNSNIQVKNCVFDSNYALTSGGGADISGLNVMPGFSFCTFTRNAAGNCGGAISSSLRYTLPLGTSSHVMSCFVGGNTAGYGGGVYNWANCTFRAISSVFSGNNATANGAAIYFDPVSKPSRIVNCTASSNVAGGAGGGFYGGAAGCSVVNTILYGNTDSTGVTPMAQINLAGAAVTVQSDDVQGGPLAGGCIAAPPLFISLLGPDGVVGTVDDNLDVMPGSPVMNAGNNAWVPAGSLDFAGNPRIIGGSVDMGAYEH